MTLVSEYRLAKFRPRSIGLALPTLSLAAAAALSGYFLDRELVEWQSYLSYGAVAVLAVFWLIPTLRFLAEGVELTSTRLLVRRGITGRVKSDIPYYQIRSVELGRATLAGRRVILHLSNQEPLVLPSLARPKQFARVLSQLVTAK